jgi:hypothetical protein
MFAADAFEPGLTLWQQIGGFLIHLIPSFVLILILVIAWKWELIGGTVIAIIGLILTPVIFITNYRMNHSIGMSIGIISMITVPFILVGVLFIISHFMKRKQAKDIPAPGLEKTE